MKTTADYIASGFEKISTDLDFLMGCLQEVLRELGEDDVADRLPWVGTKADCTEGFEQATSMAFQLLNMVEEIASSRTRTTREMESGDDAEPGLWPRQLSTLLSAGMKPEEIASALPTIRIEPVLTAHPTEAKRSAVLEQHRAIHALLNIRESARLSPSQSAMLRNEIKVVLERLWRTGEILLQKPDIATERRGVVYYLREVFPQALSRIDQRLLQAWSSLKFDPQLLANPLHRPKLRLGTWVGGDRDGHPLVTSSVTETTLRELRLNALIVLYRQLEDLAANLPLSSNFQNFSNELQIQLDVFRKENPQLAENLQISYSDEPWRQFVLHMQGKLPVSAGEVDEARLVEGRFKYKHPLELEAHLELLSQALHEGGAGRLADTAVSPVRRILDAFGFHLATLDIRQNSRFHDLAIDQLLQASGVDDCQFSEWDESRRLQFLECELRSPRPFLGASQSVGNEADAVLSCFSVLLQHKKNYGREGIGAFIVSMTRRLSDLLAVYLLARESGLAHWTREGLVCEFPVVPLFETLEDLEKGPDIVRDFLSHPVTKRSLAFQFEVNNNLPSPHRTMPIQQVMIGYSDSNKDCGIFASQWALHQSQDALAQAGREAGVKIRFFHGRGGTISRGAGPTHRFLDALPPGSVRGDLRMTEQGETIFQKYGNIDSAVYNLELLQAGVAAVSVLERPPEPDGAFTEICVHLARSSRDSYTALIRHPLFMAYYSEATPIDALETSRIGSRPSRRTGQRTLADLRAIPWVFSWNQSRHYLPGWFGVGSALQQLSKNKPQLFQRLCSDIKKSPFLYYVLTNVETNLASADREIMSLYAGLVVDPKVKSEILGIILAEFDSTKAMMSEVFGGSLERRRPRMLKTLALRDSGLRSLHIHQVEILSEWRAANASQSPLKDSLLPQVLLSINAIASGLRTTG